MTQHVTSQDDSRMPVMLPPLRRGSAARRRAEASFGAQFDEGDVSEDQLIAAWMRSELVRTGKSQRDLAAALGIDPSSASRLLDGKRELKAREAAVVLEFFGQDHPGPTGRALLVGLFSALKRTETGFVRSGEPMRQVPCPPQLEGVAGAYAVYIYDDELAPRFRAGEMLFVAPDRAPRRGDCAVIEAANGSIAIGELAVVDAAGFHLLAGGATSVVSRESARRVGRVAVAVME